MKILNYGIENNLGLVGKNIRRYLATTALTATGLMAITAPALADNWTDHVATEGSISIDTTTPSTTNITQHTDFTKVQGDGDINAGWTVNVAQPSSSSKYVLYDTENDPTMIMGALNANGEIYIFDKNGVIFDRDSQINVGSIIASTGTVSDVNIKGGKLTFENVGGPGAGEIVNNGSITVAESGLAAFVAPSVKNNGVINANAATVVLASGNTVALDLYGDNLVSIAADGALEESLIENKGAINAAGGKVALTAQAAKDAVDNVINMDGVIDVSSVTTKGGKIILGGGEKGVVKVAGKINGGNKGDIKVTGQTVDVASTADIENGDNGNTYVYGNEKTSFSGKLTTGRYSNAEISGSELVLRGRYDLGEYTYLLFDPVTLDVDALAAANFVSALNNMNVTVDVAASERINLNADLDSSGQVTNSILRFKDEDSNGNLRIDLNAKVKLGANQTLMGEGTLVNVSAVGLIQNGVDVAAAGATVNVAAGTYNESVNVNKALTLNGANAGVDPTPTTLSRGAETIITPNSPGIRITADNVTVDGFAIDGADNGIEVVGADNVLLTNNIITNSTLNGILVNASNFVRVFDNVIDSAALDGIAFLDSDSGWAQHNYISGIGYNGISSFGGTTHFWAHVNTITNTGTAGIGETAAIWVDGTDTRMSGNIIDDADRGIYVNNSPSVYIHSNHVKNTADEGIFVELSKNTTITSNRVRNTGGVGDFGNDGIRVKQNSDGLLIANNFVGVDGVAPFINGNGIRVEDSTGGTVSGNQIGNTHAESQPGNSDDASGIYLRDSFGITVDNNKIRNADWDGIKLGGGADHIVTNNDIATSTRIGIYGEGTTRSTITGNKVFDSNLAESGGIELRDGEGHLVAGNEVWNDAGSTGDHGIVLAVGADDSVVSENTIYDVKGNGVMVKDSDNALVQFNKIDDVKGNGVFMNNSDKSRVFDNVIDSAALDGIAFLDSDSGWAQHNYISGIGYNGISSFGGTTHFWAHVNTITNTGTAGIGETAAIWVDGTDTRMSGNIIDDADRGIYVNNSPSVYIHSNHVKNTADEGIFVELSKNTTITSNRVRNTGGVGDFGNDGIRVKQNSDGLLIANNFVGVDGVAPFINGNGIRVEDSTGGTVSGNQIGNTHAESQPGNSDDASGIYLRDSFGITVDNNKIRNADWDGIKLGGGADHIVTNNDIATSTRIGIYGEGTTRSTITGNKVFDSNLAESGGIELRDGEGHLVAGNEVWNDEGSTGHHGIVLRVHADGSTVRDNNVHNILRHGILVEESDNADIDSNIITDVGYDGIHVHGWGEYVFNNVLIRGNTITNTGDDGIEVHDGKGLIEIIGNKVTNAGIYSGTGFDEFNGGNDGITVRNIFGSSIIVDDEEPSEETRVALFAMSGPSAIRITNNEASTEGGTTPGILTSGDDGIEVVDADAYTYIVDNTIDDSGFSGTGPDEYGADGIHVRNVYDSSNGSALSSLARLGDIGNGEYNIVVSSNTISNSQDDGIEILGSGGSILMAARILEDYIPSVLYGTTGRVLVSQNNITNSGIVSDGEGEGDVDSFAKEVYNSGGDGIHVAGVNPGYYGSVGAVLGGTFVGYAVDVLNNIVNNSGDDGIEVINSSSTLIDQNTVTNSGLTGGDSWGGDGIHVRNVGGSYRIPKIYALEGPGDGFKEYSVVIRRNTVDNSNDDGIQVHNSNYGEVIESDFKIFDLFGETAPVLIGGNNAGDGNTVTDSGFHGLYISGPGHNNVIVSGNAFTDFNTGGQFESGLIDLTGASNTWTNGFIGLRFSPILIGYTGGESEGDLGDPIYAYLDLVDNDGDEDGLGSTPFPATPTNFGGTIGAQIFNGFTEEGDYYVYLDDGAFTNNGTPIWLNGLNSTYDGITPSLTGGALSPVVYDYLEARFQHYPDNELTDIFWFGFIPDAVTLALIAQEDLFNYFDPFNGDITGLNVRITGLPRLPGQPATGGTPTATNLNNIQTFAGNTPTNPADLNNIETAAGGTGGQSQGQGTAQDLNNINTEAGGEGSSQNCWSNAVNAAAGGQTVNVVYGGSFDSNLETAAACGTGF